MNQNEMKKRTKSLAIKIVRLYQTLPQKGPANVLGGQVLRSGTSVGANYRAACRARSIADFISKMGIVEEELDETMYWLELLVECEILKQNDLESLMGEANELLAIIVASIKTAKKNR